MKRSTLRVLLSRAGGLAPPGYFAARTCPDHAVRLAIRPRITPAPAVAAALAARMVRS